MTGKPIKTTFLCISVFLGGDFLGRCKALANQVLLITSKGFGTQKVASANLLMKFSICRKARRRFGNVKNLNSGLAF